MLNEKFRTLATDLMTAFEAQPATLTMLSRSYNPSTMITATTTTTVSTTVVLSVIKIENDDGNKVSTTVATLAAEGLNTEPKTDDMLSVNGKAYRIAKVEMIAPLGSPIIYKLHLGDL